MSFLLSLKRELHVLFSSSCCCPAPADQMELRERESRPRFSVSLFMFLSLKPELKTELGQTFPIVPQSPFEEGTSHKLST